MSEKLPVGPAVPPSMLEHAIAQLEEARRLGLLAIAACETKEELEQVRIELLGRERGLLTILKSYLS